MNDLQTLRAALTPDEVPQDVVDRSRHRLQNRMLGAPRRRIRPYALGAGLVAAAAAAAVVVATLPGPAPAPAPQPQAAAPVDTGRQILLAAATVAERTQVGAGKYWHTTTKVGTESWEYWTTTDGHEWYRTERTGGKAVLESRPRPFRLTGAEVTLSQILALPTDPKALRDWLAEGLARNKYPAKQRDMAALESLVMLVSTVPSPPAVRAAAFRAIADYPGVHALGAVPGGEGVELPGGGHLVVDPQTGKVDGSKVFLNANGTPATNAEGDTYAVSAEWTDDLPK